jgi:hypothetical protein
MQMWKLLFVAVLLHSGVVMAIEEPKFKVISQVDEIEIRQYEPMLVAETLVNSDFEKSGSQAFRILADYIFGNNQSQTKISMTAPVTQSSSEKIEMTAPVGMSKKGEGYLIQFTMPQKYTLATIPKPNDPRVQLTEIPARKIAVFGYSGSWSEERYQDKLSHFKDLLQKNKLKSVGEPVFARFNSPFMIWFLRRNEIWIQLTD